ncbi:MAG: tetratricopeptide repeat protein [Gemmatimonadota bacterium]
MNFEKLKDAARKFEQKEDWRRAIEVYLKAIQEFESGHDPAPDLSIYNRVGDLYLKANEPGAAVQAYERAADLYRDQGFLNNAIALCGKILRVNPGRIQAYLKLAHLHARKNVVIEAKKNLLEYLERMNALNQLDEAFKAMKDFADEFPGNKEIRLMLSELLRASSRNEEAKEQLEKLASDLEARGDTIGARKTLQRLHAIESGDPGGGTAPAAPIAPRRGELIFLDTGDNVTPHGGGRAARPTTPSRGRPTVVTSIPLIEIPPEPAADAHAAAGTIDETPGDIEPLTIETSSLVDEPLALDAIEPLSEEAAVELSAQEIGKALGFESSELDLAADSVAPLEGLEMDTPLEEIDLSPAAFAGDTDFVERQAELADSDVPSLLAPVDGLEGQGDFAVESSLLDDDSLLEPPADDFPSVLETLGDETPDLSADLALDLEDMPALVDHGEHDEALGLDLLPDGEAVDPSADAEQDDADFGVGAAAIRTSISVPFLEVAEPLQPSITELEDLVFDDPDNPESHRALGEALLAAGEKERGADELDLALVAYEGLEDWMHALDLVNELIRLEPNGIRYHQKRVELAYRTADKGRLIEAYVELGDALMRAGALDKALAVYRRVAEHDPGNRRALAALDALEPVDAPVVAPEPLVVEEPEPLWTEEDLAIEAGAPPAPEFEAAPPPAPSPRVPAAKPVISDEFIDLGALIMEDDRPRDTRMKVEDEEPTGDEQRDFDDMLMQFKRGIDENIDAEDFQAHYDLGVAFKEMGLLDEAIAEFQKALRAPETRLRTSEALGVAFFEKGQFAIAEAILRRAVESLGATDDEQIGLIYWLGRSAEAQGKNAAAVPCYQRILAVDIGFQDVSARMAKLAAEGA